MNQFMLMGGAVLASLFLVPNPSPAQEKTAPTGDLVELASEAGRFTKLLAAAEAAGLVDTLRSKGPFTLFAPTDAAFAKQPKGALDALLADEAKLKSVLLYHVVPGKLQARQIVELDWAKTAQGQSLRVGVGEDGVTVDGARVVTADLMATNGVVHVIDTVVVPRPDLVATAVAAKQFQTLAKALQAAELVEALQAEGPFTVFAPTDAAFAKLPEGSVARLLENPDELKAILLLHVVPGRVLSSDIPAAKDGRPSLTAKTLAGRELRIVRDRSGVTIDGAKVTSADVLAGNGVIHVIDTVILPAAK